MRALLLCFFALACSSDAHSRCQRVCTREAKCAAELDLPDWEVDRSECIDACNRLDRDPDLARAVERHVRCVDSAPGCSAVLDCE